MSRKKPLSLEEAKKSVLEEVTDRPWTHIINQASFGHPEFRQLVHFNGNPYMGSKGIGWVRRKGDANLIVEAVNQYDHLKESLRRCASFAGHPDPKEGCRLICVEVKKILNEK